MQLLVGKPSRGPRILKPQERGDAAGIVNERFEDSALPGRTRLFIANPLRRGPPILNRQTAQTTFPTEGTDRLGGAPGRVWLPLLNRKGPPILNRQTTQTGFPTEGVTPDTRITVRFPRLPLLNRKGPPILAHQYGYEPAGIVNERFVDQPLPGSQRLMLLGIHPRAGPPILLTQQEQSVFPTAGNDRTVDQPLAHPLLRFRIGKRWSGGPPIVLATQFMPALAGGAGPAVEGGFPTQFAGFRVWNGFGVMKELCLVAEADAPAGMGGVMKMRKGSTTYAVYLVELADPYASPVRIRTTTGTKAVRLKT